ncbi:hypothetical protein [Spirulina sp. 06S082]|uniref:hypothetical protein n=1 Tax=Spirulina sp. 06S082 TaxID=3110248 RepID=UPI002B20F78D|nr:hypothetical protein [Spirulina sp. 06S082]MEA5467597.1 hypothetical protein [Spirulina sp. 06S082]
MNDIISQKKDACSPIYGFSNEMNQTPSISDPSVDIFLYDLYSGLGKSEQDISSDRRRFWNRIYDENYIEQNLEAFKKKERDFSNYIELLDSQIKPFDAPLDGYYYPVKLGDTLALQINCTGRNNDPDREQNSTAQRFIELQKFVRIIDNHTTKTPAQLGQSWLFLGQIDSATQDTKEIEKIAESCYKHLEITKKINWKQDLIGRGIYQEAYFYELEQPDIILDGENRTHHLLICLFPQYKTQTEIEKIIGDLYPDFMALFHYRSKILWVCEQSRTIKTTLKGASEDIKNMVENISKRLENSQLDLKHLQKDLGNALEMSRLCGTHLSYFQEYLMNLEINRKNYQNRLQWMRDRDNSTLCDLKFFETFANSTQYKTDQIEMDYKVLNEAIKPLNSFIQTIEGIIAIERIQNERTLNNTIAIAGVGISVASLIASTIGQEESRIIIKQFVTIPEESISSFLQISLILFPLAMSIFLGIISAVLTSFLLRFFKK